MFIVHLNFQCVCVYFDQSIIWTIRQWYNWCLSIFRIGFRRKIWASIRNLLLSVLHLYHAFHSLLLFIHKLVRPLINSVTVFLPWSSSQNQELNRIFTVALFYMQLRHCIALKQIEKTFKSVLRHLIYCKEAQCSSQVYDHDLHWNMQRAVYSTLLLLLLLLCSTTTLLWNMQRPVYISPTELSIWCVVQTCIWLPRCAIKSCKLIDLTAGGIAWFVLAVFLQVIVHIAAETKRSSWQMESPFVS